MILSSPNYSFDNKYYSNPVFRIFNFQIDLQIQCFHTIEFFLQIKECALVIETSIKYFLNENLFLFNYKLLRESFF